jgi:arylsulfatase A-like enzyme
MATTRRAFLNLSLLSAAGLAQVARPRRPNIVWIMADDLGYGDLGCYGQKIIRTPHLDRMAGEGMRFTDAYAGCTVCAPSRSVLMTGYHMGHASVRSNPGGVPLLASDVTVAECLKQGGYRTGGFGKWGLGDNGTDGAPWKQGFDEFFGYLNQVHAHWFYPEFLYDNDRRHPLPANAGGRHGTYSHDVIADRGLDFIRRNKDGPFFCYLAFTLPHLELLVPDDSMRPYRGKLDEKPYIDPRKHYADQPEARAAYAGMVSRLDRDVGRVLELLKQLRIDGNTIVFFTSDNGSAVPLWGEDYFRSTGGLRGHKQNLYEGGIRVPMIARWPGHIPRGTINDHRWAFWDVLPTLCDIAGVESPSGIDGRSVLPALHGRKQAAAEFMYWEQPRYIAAKAEFPDEIPMQAVRWGEWKALRPKPDATIELYNLSSDPGEKVDLSRTEPEVLARIEKYLSTARTPPRPQRDPPQDFRRPA